MPQVRTYRRANGWYFDVHVGGKRVRRLLGACNRGTTGLRAQALLLMLWRAGLRVGEALTLLARDVDTVDGIVRVRAGKTGSRVVALAPEACAVIARWPEKRRTLGANRLRHSFAQDLAMEGQPLLVTQQALGHKHASTTSEYLNDLLPTQLVDTLRNRPAWSSD